MNQFSVNVQIMIFIASYLLISLIVVFVRSAIDCNQLSWIGRDGFWSYLWPRLKFWLIGVVCITLIVTCINYFSHNNDNVFFENIFNCLGIFSIIPIIIGGYIVICIFLGIFAPFFAMISENYEID